MDVKARAGRRRTRAEASATVHLYQVRAYLPMMNKFILELKCLKITLAVKLYTDIGELFSQLSRPDYSK